MKTILVVDDNVEICKLLKTMFQCLKSDIEILTTTNVKESLSYMNKRNIDLFIVDIIMPEINGITLCEMIRKASDNPIITITAKLISQEEIAELESNIVDEVVQKPFDTIEFVKKVDKYL